MFCWKVDFFNEVEASCKEIEYNSFEPKWESK